MTDYYSYTTVGATPELVWMVLAVASIALFICAFSKSLRYETGETNSERTLFSMFGGVFNLIVAYLSLTIDMPAGAGLHTIYQGGAIVWVFIIIGLICFVNVVYTIMQPEVIKPELENEMGGHGVSAGVRAEGKRQ